MHAGSFLFSLLWDHKEKISDLHSTSTIFKLGNIVFKVFFKKKVFCFSFCWVRFFSEMEWTKNAVKLILAVFFHQKILFAKSSLSLIMPLQLFLKLSLFWNWKYRLLVTTGVVTFLKATGDWRLLCQWYG